MSWFNIERCMLNELKAKINGVQSHKLLRSGIHEVRVGG